MSSHNSPSTPKTDPSKQTITYHGRYYVIDGDEPVTPKLSAKEAADLELQIQKYVPGSIEYYINYFQPKLRPVLDTVIIMPNGDLFFNFKVDVNSNPTEIKEFFGSLEQQFDLDIADGVRFKVGNQEIEVG